jgi:hypothetical protein
VNDDHDLRSRLERIASSAGDPPEHGLDRVTARRHRRLRRRRGAVATAAVLAVLAFGASLISHGRDDGRQSVTAVESATPAGAPAEVPRLVEVRCETTGIVVPVASVRPDRDGLHIRVHNSLPEPTTIMVESEQWFSGDIRVPRGVHEVVQPVPPGRLAIACDIGGLWQRRHVDLVDPSGYYQVPELGCDEADRTSRFDVPVESPSRNLVEAVRTGLDPVLVGGSDNTGIGAPRGYPAQRLNDPTEDPVVQVVRDGEVIAFAHVRGRDGVVAAPWTTLSEVKVCRSALAAAADGAETPGGAAPATGGGEAASSTPG